MARKLAGFFNLAAFLCLATPILAQPSTTAAAPETQYLNFTVSGVSQLLPNGAVASLVISTPGAGQTAGTYTMVATGGGGTGATANIVVAADGTVHDAPVITNPGAGYTSDPTFIMPSTAEPNGSTPATFKATISEYHGSAYNLVKQGTIDAAHVRVLVNEFATIIHNTDPQCSADKSSFLINIVLFNSANGDQPGLTTGIVQSSHWYVYEGAQGNFTEATSQTARVFGSTNPYVIAIHVNAKYNLASPPGYVMKYPYTEAHRTAANWQAVADAIALFQGVIQHPASGGPNVLMGQGTFWAWDQMSINTPANISISAAVSITPQDPTKTIPLDTKPVTYNDEGFYHWDVSVGVPITAYSQIQNVVPQNGTIAVPASVDKRNLLLLGNWYVKPVDLSGQKISYIPYLVGGISVASKPLHGLMAAVGIGTPVGLYIGSMAVTSNVANNKTVTHYKLAFGLNLPVRAIMGKLGINTQISSGGS